MANYIDGFILPIPKNHLEEYQRVAETVAKIWKEHGALSYFEFVGDELILEGTRSFTEAIDAKENEAIVFGYVTFESKEVRNLANERVAADPRMVELIAPLIDSSRVIFDATRMVFGGFRSLVK